jgi:uncharacterized protein YjdB
MNVNDLTSNNTPMRWRIQGDRIAGTDEENLLEEGYKEVLSKAKTFMSDEELGVGNQPGGGDTVEPDPILVSSVEITGEDDVVIGETLALGVKVLPNNADNKTVTWSTSDGAIATVDASGVVTGVSAGNVEIIATSNDANAAKDIVEIEIL